MRSPHGVGRQPVCVDCGVCARDVRADLGLRERRSTAECQRGDAGDQKLAAVCTAFAAPGNPQRSAHACWCGSCSRHGRRTHQWPRVRKRGGQPTNSRCCKRPKKASARDCACWSGIGQPPRRQPIGCSIPTPRTDRHGRRGGSVARPGPDRSRHQSGQRAGDDGGGEAAALPARCRPDILAGAGPLDLVGGGELPEPQWSPPGGPALAAVEQSVELAGSRRRASNATRRMT